MSEFQIQLVGKTREHLLFTAHQEILIQYAVRVKGGMSLWNGMWNDVRNGIIMQNTSCGMT